MHDIFAVFSLEALFFRRYEKNDECKIDDERTRMHRCLSQTRASNSNAEYFPEIGGLMHLLLIISPALVRSVKVLQSPRVATKRIPDNQEGWEPLG
jgi:hypothetical protein